MKLIDINKISIPVDKITYIKDKTDDEFPTIGLECGTTIICEGYSKTEILAKLNEPDNWNHLEDAAMNEHKGSEFVEAVKELVNVCKTVFITEDFDELIKVEKLLEDK